MKTRSTLIAAVALVALLMLPGCPEKGDPKADLAAVNGVLDQIATAMKAGDVEAIMAAYESDPEPVGYFVAGEMSGKSTIRQGWVDFFANNKVISIEFTDVHKKLDRHLAVIYCLWNMEVETGGAVRQMHGRLTTVLGKHGGKWYVHHDHISMPLTMPAAPASAADEG